MQLGQSPFINILSDRKVSETLAPHGQPTQHSHHPGGSQRTLCADRQQGHRARFDFEPGRPVRDRLDAVGCSSGDTLAKEQEEAASKHDVLKALSKAAASLRTKLGESLASVQKFDVPVEATTPSLEALKAYSMGITTGRTKGDAEAIPFMKRAIELDPNFAMAYVGLAVEYANLGRASLAAENAKKAYDLRDRVSERERYRISAFYFQYVTGEVEKATEAYELWAKSYPRDPVPHGNLGFIYSALGQYDKSIVETEAQQRLEAHDCRLWKPGRHLHQPQSPEGSSADSRGSPAENLSMASPFAAICTPWHFCPGMRRKWNARSPGPLAAPAKKTRCSATTPILRPTTAAWRKPATSPAAPLIPPCAPTPKKPAPSGSPFRRSARLKLATSLPPGKTVTRALALAPGRDVKVLAAVALARSGETTQSRTLIEGLQKSEPGNTYLKVYWFPVIEASIAMAQQAPDRAIIALEPSLPYELGGPPPGISMYPAYIRGLAYLAQKSGPAAAAEFQKFLDHSGVVQNFLLGSLAHLQLGRAYVISGDTAKAKAAYQDFLTLWKDADADIPILKEAKTEYAKLQ